MGRDRTDTTTHTFTFDSTNTINIIFKNAPASIDQISHLEFRGPEGTIAPGDSAVVANPTLTVDLASQIVNGTVFLYVNDSFPLTESSRITLTTANAITGLTFNMF